MAVVSLLDTDIEVGITVEGEEEFFQQFKGLILCQDVIVKIISMENEVNADIDRLVDLKAEIMRVIKAVASPEHQTLLELRYLCFKPWKVIADRMGYNVRHVYRLHDEAVESITIP